MGRFLPTRLNLHIGCVTFCFEAIGHQCSLTRSADGSGHAFQRFRNPEIADVQVNRRISIEEMHFYATLPQSCYVNCAHTHAHTFSHARMHLPWNTLMHLRMFCVCVSHTPLQTRTTCDCLAQLSCPGIPPAAHCWSPRRVAI